MKVESLRIFHGAKTTVGAAVVFVLVLGLCRPTYVTYATHSAGAAGAQESAGSLSIGYTAYEWSNCLENNPSFYELVMTQLNIEEKVYFVQMSPFLSQITKASEKIGLPPFVVASHIKRESQFDPRAVSSKDAFGLMGITVWAYEDVMRLRYQEQWIREALEEYGTVYWEDAQYDPELNILVGAIYYKFLLDHFQNTQLASLAYNWGMGNVQRMLDKYGSTNRVLERLEELASKYPAWVEPAEYPGHIARLQTIFQRLQERIELAYVTYREIRPA
jgi:soluble lytic murein transglycosylase